MNKEVAFFVELGADGKPLSERVEVIDNGDGTLTLLRSPLWVAGLAKRDTVTIDERGVHRLVRPGGMTCVQVFLPRDVAASPHLEEMLVEIAHRFGGSLDARSRLVLSFTFEHRDPGRIKGFLDALEAMEGMEAVVGNPD